MSRAVAGLALAVSTLTFGSATTQGQSRIQEAAETLTAPVLRTSNPTFLASLERIGSGSGLWREALEALRGTGRHAVLLTPDQVVVADSDGKGPSGFETSMLAEVAALPAQGSEVGVVIVVVNLALLEQVHSAKGSLPAEFDADLDRILVHEIYGHALPYLLAGDRSGRCADPMPNERPSEACSIRRENAVRAELGLGRRVDSGLEGLALARRERF